jgi:hypothetical protein
MKPVIIAILFSSLLVYTTKAQKLKSVIYDFDGLDIGGTNLPDGDYCNNDLTYKVAANPLSASDIIGDRVLELDLQWNSGNGEFGKGTARFYELNSSGDRLNFYFYNPLSNSEDANLEVSLLEDDDKNNVFDYSNDDSWTAFYSIPKSSEWQLISIPLSSFTDNNTGGNGIFDASYSNEGGMIFSVNFTLRKAVPDHSTSSYYIDMISFSEGALPSGSTFLNLPGRNDQDYCLLGALTGDATAVTAASTPAVINNLFPTRPKIRYVNWFVDYANYGTTPTNLPGSEVQSLLDNGYRPVITWESLFASYGRLDPVQPRLFRINNGSLDGYIDAFAEKIKQYDDTIIMRIFHEFEGDWYPWSLKENNHDPNEYISAFRHVVDRFRAKGADKVLWMWCVNADPKPYVAYNWIISAYPGDDYVNIVATDVYNHPDLGVPEWRSFRFTYSETYYYLTKYFPNKPLYICEVASRERDGSENPGSQSKADWICQMDKELQTYFNKTRALIFFSAIKEHDWRINSSPPAKDAAGNCIWEDNYYFKRPVSVEENALSDLTVFPNPFNKNITIVLPDSIRHNKNAKIRFYDLMGNNICCYELKENVSFGADLPSGVYIVDIENIPGAGKIKVVKINDE